MKGEASMESTERIQHIIAEECFLKPELITNDASFAELGVDSLALIQIWMRIGQELEIEIPDLDEEFWRNNTFSSLGEMAAVVEQLRNMSKAAALTAAGSD
jgi:acyl carrier protein